MNRIGKIILTSVAALSLLVCVATVGLWVRSYWREDLVYKYDGSGAVAIGSGRGGISIERVSLNPSYRSEWQWRSNDHPRDRRVLAEQWFAGFGYRNRSFPACGVKDIVIPCWALLRLSA